MWHTALGLPAAETPMAGEHSPIYRVRLQSRDQTALNRIAEMHGLTTTQALRMAVRFADCHRVLYHAPKHIQTLNDANNQIRRLGVNLNQLVRTLHLTELDDPEIANHLDQLHDLLPAINAISKEIQKLVNESRSI